MDEDEDQYQLYLQFFAWYCKGLSIVPLRDFAKYKTYKLLPNQTKYFSNSDEKIFTDLRKSKVYSSELEKVTRDDSDLTITVMLKEAAEQKMRLRILPR